jgi:hypothetical protein
MILCDFVQLFLFFFDFYIYGKKIAVILLNLAILKRRIAALSILYTDCSPGKFLKNLANYHQVSQVSQAKKSRL